MATMYGIRGFNRKLTAKMKKSSCIQATQPKFVYLKTLSMTHMTLAVNPLRATKRVMHKGTSAVDWWFGRKSRR